MEVAASAWVFAKKHAGKVKGERATKFGVTFSAERIVLATTSTLDWISDGNYAWEVLGWSNGEYEPTLDEQLECLDAKSWAPVPGRRCLDTKALLDELAAPLTVPVLM